MSYWTHVRMLIELDVPGETQPQKDYILKTVLSHLPKITGSEVDAEVYMIQREGDDSSSSCDEFGQYISRDYWLRTQRTYFIVVAGDLRDRFFDQTMKEAMKFICRLGSRLLLDSVHLEVIGYTNRESDDGEKIVVSKDLSEEFLEGLWVSPSWCNEGTINWCEYLQPRFIYNGKRYEGKPDFAIFASEDLLTQKEQNKFLSKGVKHGKQGKNPRR